MVVFLLLVTLLSIFELRVVVDLVDNCFWVLDWLLSLLFFGINICWYSYLSRLLSFSSYYFMWLLLTRIYDPLLQPTGVTNGCLYGVGLCKIFGLKVISYRLCSKSIWSYVLPFPFWWALIFLACKRSPISTPCSSSCMDFSGLILFVSLLWYTPTYSCMLNWSRVGYESKAESSFYSSCIRASAFTTMTD